ncbi:MAG TPA: glycosyltransferase family 39 protein [Bacteroidia bacterium]|nr:glycosyltransferase family 39 protein [Bacteroidia bacterium]
MDENKFLFKKDGTLLFLIISIHVACWFILKPIFPQGDPLVYFVNAKRILDHEYFFSYSVQSHRYGVFIPQTVFIGLFGESPYIINLWMLVCSLLMLSLMYFFALKYINRMVAVIAGLLLAVNLIQIIYSSVVFPDIIVSFFALCCVYFIYIGRQDENKWLKNSLFFILSFAFGFSAKESIVVIIPFIGFILWKDWRRNNFPAFQKSICVLLVLFILFVFAVSKTLTDDFMFFYNSYGHYTVFVPFTGVEDFLKHISYKPLLWFNSQLGYIFLFIFSIPAFADGIVKKDKFTSLESFISLYVIILLLSLWCGSISIFNFGYIPMVDRRWMTLIAPLCILSAITIHKIIQNTASQKNLYLLIAAFLLFGIINWIEFTIIRGALFFGFAVMLALQEMAKKKIENNYLIRAGLLLLPFFILAIQFLRTNSNYIVPAN